MIIEAITVYCYIVYECVRITVDWNQRQVKSKSVRIDMYITLINI